MLAAAREMTLDGTISEATFATLRKHFDNERLVDLVVAIAHYNGIVRVLAAFAVDVEDEYKPYLEKFRCRRSAPRTPVLCRVGKSMTVAIRISIGRLLPPASRPAVAELRPHFGSRLSELRGIREEHGRGFSHHPSVLPDAVVFARSTAEVQQVVRACARFGVPVIPYGTGTSAHGQIAALKGGISLDLSGMDQIIAVHPEDLDVVVQPGVRRKTAQPVPARAAASSSRSIRGRRIESAG